MAFFKLSKKIPGIQIRKPQGSFGAPKRYLPEHIIVGSNVLNLIWLSSNSLRDICKKIINILAGVSIVDDRLTLYILL